MTLNNKSWLKNEAFRLYLTGDSQENIAKELNISTGMVNSFVNDFINSDDTIELIRQIAIVLKKNRMDLKQIAANLRWENKIKQSSLDDRKIEKFLGAVAILFNKYSIAPSTAANQLFSIIETMLRENIEPHRLEDEIRMELNRLKVIKTQIESNEELLEKSNAKLEKEMERLKIKQKDLDDFVQVRNMLGFFGNHTNEFSEEYPTLARAMVDFRKMNYYPKIIISQYEKMNSLREANEKLGANLQRSEKVLQDYRRKQVKEEARWNGYDKTLKILSSLVNEGLGYEDIFRLVHIIKNDFPERSIQQIEEDLHTYGSLSAAAWRLKRLDDIENEPML